MHYIMLCRSGLFSSDCVYENRKLRCLWPVSYPRSPPRENPGIFLVLTDFWLGFCVDFTVIMVFTAGCLVVDFWNRGSLLLGDLTCVNRGSFILLVVLLRPPVSAWLLTLWISGVHLSIKYKFNKLACKLDYYWFIVHTPASQLVSIDLV